MAAKPLIGALVLGTGAFVLIAATWQHPEPVLETPPPREEPQWLSREAAHQIFGANGELGPLFDGAILGGSAPLPETRARIAAFAKANNVDIDLEIRDGELRAVELDVTFGGCCGYEGVDVLARGLGRPRYSESCGGPYEWINTWVVNAPDNTRMRARANVNRLTTRWEPRLSLPELAARADGLLGQRAAAVARDAGETWREIEPGLYLLEVPFAFVSDPAWGQSLELRSRNDLGMFVRVDAGAIVEIKFTLPSVEDEVVEVFSKRWGRMRDVDDVRTWKKAGRVVKIQQVDMPTTVVITAG